MTLSRVIFSLVVHRNYWTPSPSKICGIVTYSPSSSVFPAHHEFIRVAIVAQWRWIADRHLIYTHSKQKPKERNLDKMAKLSIMSRVICP
jgi:hypothetical protein